MIAHASSIVSELEVLNGESGDGQYLSDTPIMHQLKSCDDHKGGYSLKTTDRFKLMRVNRSTDV